MDKANSFKSYNKVDQELQEQTYHRNTRKRLIIIVISVIVLVLIVIAALVGTLVPLSNKKSEVIRTSSSIIAICNVTLYPESCSQSLKASSNNTEPNPNPKDLFKLSMLVALNELTKLSSSSLPNAFGNTTDDPLLQGALSDCTTLIDNAIDHINESITSMQLSNENNLKPFTSIIHDIRTWLSTAMTDQDTCLDGLMEVANHTIVADEMRYAMRNSTEFTSNSLAIASNMLSILHYLKIPVHRNLLPVDDHNDEDDHLPLIHGRLLAEENLKPDLIVAKDGSGDFKTINEAINSVPKKKKKTRFVIYIKEGVYLENVEVDKEHWNVMIYGDGMTKTIVSGSLNKVDGTSTFTSGTLIVAGRGFIAKDMGFINTSGPEKHQAVALRSSSDKSVFYRCSFDSYQDTLYTHSNRQFYRDCHIIGTIDFIFGNAAVVLQNCSIQPRQPMPKQFNTITAQSKTDPNQNTGISIQRCQISPFDNLTAPTYLGRPWKDYATTLFMQSNIGGFMDDEGWAQWIPGVDPPSTIFYAEFQNVGPGSVTSGRVKWPGVRPSIALDEAVKFTVEPFIQGSQWLSEANVIFDEKL